MTLRLTCYCVWPSAAPASTPKSKLSPDQLVAILGGVKIRLVSIEASVAFAKQAVDAAACCLPMHVLCFVSLGGLNRYLVQRKLSERAFAYMHAWLHGLHTVTR